MNHLTDTLHLLLCQKPHVRDMLKIVDRHKDLCYYYLENDISGGNEMESHFEWHKIKENFIRTLGFKSDTEALDFLRQCISLSQDLQKLSGENSHKAAFIKSILL